ncbi:MAG: hypothetical protein Q4G48_02415 [Bacteroidia bacterium]|nr:hypothetical protein [Bacteroidia bacterium]
MFKFLLILAIIYLAFNFLNRFLFGTRRKTHGNPYRQSRPQQEKTPETQEDRILDYQRKSFEKTDAVDVEFEEIKQKE